MKVIVPLSIKKQVVRERIVRLSFFMFVLILLMLLFIFFAPLSQLKLMNKLLTFGLCLLGNALITGVPFKLIRRGWQGEVVDVNVRTSTDSINPTRPTVATWYTVNTVILTLKTPKGELIVKEADKMVAKHSQMSIENYDKEDYVVKISGTEYIAHYKHETNETRCVYCDNYVSNEAQDCEKCGRKIVTFVK